MKKYCVLEVYLRIIMEKEEYSINDIINEIIVYQKYIKMQFSIVEHIIDDTTDILQVNEQLGLIRKKIQNYIFDLNKLDDLLLKKIEKYPNIEINNMTKVRNLIQSIRDNSFIMCQNIHRIAKSNKLKFL